MFYQHCALGMGRSLEPVLGVRLEQVIQVWNETQESVMADLKDENKKCT